MTNLIVTKDDARRIVANGFGPILVEHGFRALPSGLRFKRAVPEGTQEFEVILAMNPPYHQGAIHFLPQYTWHLPKVGALCNEMTGGNNRLGRINSVVFFTQLAMLSYTKEPGDWYFDHPSQAPEISRVQAEFFSRWVVPFCDEYKSAEDLVRGYFTEDPRLFLNLYEVPSVAAALVILGRRDEARELIQSNLTRAEELHYSLRPVLKYIDGLGGLEPVADQSRAGSAVHVDEESQWGVRGRWGRLDAPPEAAGCWVLIEPEDSSTWKVPPPPDATRVWQRRPGTASDHDDNWSVWLHEADVLDWCRRAGWRVSEWLPAGEEPDWEVWGT